MVRLLPELALGLYWLALFIATHVPRIPEPLETGVSDKWLHYLAYGGLGFLLVPVARRNWPFRRISPERWEGNGGREVAGTTVLALVAVLLIGIGYGALDEWLQGFVGRDPDIQDWFADCGGLLTGIAAGQVTWLVGKRWLMPK